LTVDLYPFSTRMLTWRAISRSATTIRQGSQFQRRFIHPSSRRFQRPNTLIAKIRFRADGKPRSKLIAVGFGSLIFLNFVLLLILSEVVEDGEMSLGLMASLIYIQRTDITYDSVDFDDPLSTLSYFKKLYQSFSRVSEEEVEQLFKDLTRLLKIDASQSAEVEAQHIMRSAAEKIHVAFRELNQDSIANTANYVFLVLKEALESLVNLVQDSDDDDDDDDSKYTFQLIRDHTKKDPGVLKEYEVLG